MNYQELATVKLLGYEGETCLGLGKHINDICPLSFGIVACLLKVFYDNFAF